VILIFFSTSSESKSALSATARMKMQQSCTLWKMEPGELTGITRTTLSFYMEAVA